MTRDDNYDQALKCSSQKASREEEREREREREASSIREQGVSPMKWSNIDFTQAVAIESRMISVALSKTSNQR